MFVYIDSSWVRENTQYPGVNKFPQYFNTIDGEFFEPEFDYCIENYLCKSCGQAWYFEFDGSDCPDPIFGIKLTDIKVKLSRDDIYSYKEFITILAYDGFESTKCRYKNCGNYKLKGKEICQVHHTLP